MSIKCPECGHSFARFTASVPATLRFDASADGSFKRTGLASLQLVNGLSTLNLADEDVQQACEVACPSCTKVTPLSKYLVFLTCFTCRSTDTVGRCLYLKQNLCSACRAKFMGDYCATCDLNEVCELIKLVKVEPKLEQKDEIEL